MTQGGEMVFAVCSVILIKLMVRLDVITVDVDEA